MTVAYYPAIIERGRGGYSVFFHDLPGCASGGDTIDLAARNAEDALRGHLALMIADGDELPVPTAFDKIRKDPDVKEAARVLVRADLPSKSVRLNISLDEGLVASIDSTAEQVGMTRSGLIATASRDFISHRANNVQVSKRALRKSSNAMFHAHNTKKKVAVRKTAAKQS